MVKNKTIIIYTVNLGGYDAFYPAPKIHNEDNLVLYFYLSLKPKVFIFFIIN
jgi:hypothetical protein